MLALFLFFPAPFLHFRDHSFSLWGGGRWWDLMVGLEKVSLASVTAPPPPPRFLRNKLHQLILILSQNFAWPPPPLLWLFFWAALPPFLNSHSFCRAPSLSHKKTVPYSGFRLVDAIMSKPFSGAVLTKPLKFSSTLWKSALNVNGLFGATSYFSVVYYSFIYQPYLFSLSMHIDVAFIFYFLLLFFYSNNIEFNKTE